MPQCRATRCNQTSGRDSHIKGSGVLVGKILKEFVGVAWNVFLPLRGAIPKRQIIPCYIFSAQYPKRYDKSSSCGPLEAQHPIRYQNRVFNFPKRYDEHPRPFHMGVPPGTKLTRQSREITLLPWSFSPVRTVSWNVSWKLRLGQSHPVPQSFFWWHVLPLPNLAHVDAPRPFCTPSSPGWATRTIHS